MIFRYFDTHSEIILFNLIFVSINKIAQNESIIFLIHHIYELLKKIDVVNTLFVLHLIVL